MAHTVETYHQSIFGFDDVLFSRCLKGSAAVGVVVLLVVFLTPIHQQAITSVDQLPKRFAKLILEEPKPAAEVLQPEALAPAEEIIEETAVEEIVEPVEPPSPREREVAREVDPNAGQLGRERAQQEISSELASATAALDNSLNDLSSSLQSTQTEAPKPRRRRRSRSVRTGRSTSEVGTVHTDLASGGGPDLSSSVVSGNNVVVGTISSSSSAAIASSNAEEETSGSGAAPGVYRSNASLLAVIQKYAAGIHYCYANELKHNENLKGKLVVALTVTASGKVTNATVVENSLGSERLASCALSQIRDWKFPPIPKGLTTFQAPFVFTPPK